MSDTATPLHFLSGLHLFDQAASSRRVRCVEDLPLHQRLENAPDEAQPGRGLHAVDQHLTEGFYGKTKGEEGRRKSARGRKMLRACQYPHVAAIATACQLQKQVFELKCQFVLMLTYSVSGGGCRETVHPPQRKAKAKALIAD